MSTPSNARILSAVINKWAQPLISNMAQHLAAGKIQSIPLLGTAENWIKNLGIVSPGWKITNEIPGIIDPITSSLLLPTIHKYISTVEDAFIPQMAHDMVDRFVEQEGVVILERIRIELEDFQELKKLLNYNLPISNTEVGYVVKTTEEPKNVSSENEM